jgi:hypothetical protein
MVLDNWVRERLQTYIDNKEVAPPHEDDVSTWECWEEFNEREIQIRNVKRSVKSESLWSGDVIVWQPPAKRQRRESGEDGKIMDVTVEGAEGENVAPLYPVNNVFDLAVHVANSIDVVVVLHDAHQPLCTDGLVSSGHWTRPSPKPERTPAKGDTSPINEERPEDEILQQSPAAFRMPAEREMKMDLRWSLHDVTAVIAQQLDKRPNPEAPLLLFYGAPSSGPEEPLNIPTGRGDREIVLKDLRMHVSSPTKKPLVLHAVEVPCGKNISFIGERSLAPFCVRFYDDAVREVGSCIVAVPNNGIVSDIIDEARKKLDPAWGITGTLRVLEVIESRLHKLYRPDALVRSMACFNKANIFYNCLRIEADREPQEQKLFEIFHCDRQSQQAFAQPFLLAVTPGEKCVALKARAKAKLQVPDAEFKSWRLVRCGRAGKIHLKDDEAWDSDTSLDAKLCLEHVHPNPTNSLTRHSRYNKPLTIK